MAYEGDLCNAWEDTVYWSFSCSSDPTSESTDLNLVQPYTKMNLWNGSYNDHLELRHGFAPVYMVQGEQDEVLNNFTREEQSRVCTWQLRLPPTWANAHPQYILAPKTYRKRFEAEDTRKVSKGAAKHGMIACYAGDLEHTLNFRPEKTEHSQEQMPLFLRKSFLR